MMNLLRSDQPRNVHIAGLSYYPTPCIHPARTANEHIMFIVTEGDWEITQGDVSYTFQKGDVMFLMAGMHHYGTKIVTLGTRTIYVHFDAFEGDAFALPDDHGDRFGILPVTNCQGDPEILELFRKINNTFWSYDKRKVLLQSSYLSELLCRLERAANPEALGDEEIVSQINSLFIAHPDRFFSVEELSQKFFISKRKLYYLFKNKTGTTPHKHQINLKLDICKQQLATAPGITLKTLANSYGFCDEFHLSKLYKQRHGSSPKR